MHPTNHEAFSNNHDMGSKWVKGTAGLFFLPPGTTMNGSKYLELLKNLELYMKVHPCTIFMQDGASCHKSKIIGDIFKSSKIQILIGQTKSVDLNSIENLWVALNKKSLKNNLAISSNWKILQKLFGHVT